MPIQPVCPYRFLTSPSTHKNVRLSASLDGNFTRYISCLPAFLSCSSNWHSCHVLPHYISRAPIAKRPFVIVYRSDWELPSLISSVIEPEQYLRLRTLSKVSHCDTINTPLKQSIRCLQVAFHIIWLLDSHISNIDAICRNWKIHIGIEYANKRW